MAHWPVSSLIDSFLTHWSHRLIATMMYDSALIPHLEFPVYAL